MMQRKVGTITGAIVMLMAAGGLSACGSGGDSPEAVVEGYFSAMADDDFEGACEFLAPEVVSDMSDGCEVELQAAKAEVASQEVLENIEVTGAHINEAAGEAEVTVQSGEEDDSVDLKLISGEWKMSTLG